MLLRSLYGALAIAVVSALLSVVACRIYYNGIMDSKDLAAQTSKLNAIADSENARRKAVGALTDARLKYLADLQEKERDYENRLAELNSGTLELHVDANCAAPGMPHAGNAPSGDIPGTARLTDGAARRVLVLEQSIAKHARALELCRTYVQTVRRQFDL